MTPEEEKVEAATTRVRDLEHAVAEAEADFDKAPTDTRAKGRRDMAAAIRDAGLDALREARAASERSKGGG